MVYYELISEKRLGDVKVEISSRSDGMYSVYVSENNFKKGIFSNVVHFSKKDDAQRKYEEISSLKGQNTSCKTLAALSVTVEKANVNPPFLNSLYLSSRKVPRFFSGNPW